ncbi:MULTISPECIES: YraN family protein [Rheinheimera]|uniref:UPF0102 protein ACFO3I_13980 n=1 Tax=Rheinheimera marina TaxID=1774958 RepID=A0ABV9JPJ2_9GAMM
MNLQRGQLYEQQALRYLEQQGLTLLERNYRTSLGELDLVMQDGNCTVFVEVKFRQSRSFGGAAAAVTHAKQQKLRRAAALYLQQHGQCHCRFDVIAIGADPADIRWVKNAF